MPTPAARSPAHLPLAPAAIAGAAPGEWRIFGESAIERLTGVPVGAAGVDGLRAGASGREAVAYDDVARVLLVERDPVPELRIVERDGEARTWAVSPPTLPALRPTLERVAARIAGRDAGSLARRAMRRLSAAWRGARS